MEVREQAIWTLDNITCASPECRNLVLGSLCHTNIQTQQQVTILRNATWTLSDFCRGKLSPDCKYIQLALKALSIMLSSDDDEILQDSCCAFSYLSDIDNDNNGQIHAIINSDSLDRLIASLHHSSSHGRHPALTTIGNIATGCDEQTQYALNLGVVMLITALSATSM